MKPMVFAGPSIHGLAGENFDGIDLRGPAACGDILDAVHESARIIGLIDGLYGDCAAVWHKEILYALSKGVAVFGAASMGALRASECAPFGMIGIGDVYEAYRDGRRFSDADVAVSHAPAELACRPLTIALVDAEASLGICRDAIGEDAYEALLQAARRLHFSRRTWRAIATEADLGAEIAKLLAERAVSIKRNDAGQLLRVLRMEGVSSSSSSPSWKFQNTLFFRQLAARRTPGESA